MENTKTKIEPRLLKGFVDYGPKAATIKNAVFDKIKNIFTRYGFLELQTPVLEYSEILLGRYGEDEKLVYRFRDHGDRDVSLRYDLTVPMARYVAMNKNSIQFPFKRYAIAPVWRADNTQRGRSREFFQCDVDIVGVSSRIADVEVVNCLIDALRSIEIDNAVVNISDRRLFNSFANQLSSADKVTGLIKLVDKVYKKSNEELVEESSVKHGFLRQDHIILLSVLDFIRDAKSLDQLSEITQVDAVVFNDIKTVIQKINDINPGKVRFNLGITRGLEYYTSTVFEIFTEEENLAIGSGGRYDTLLESYEKSSLPAVGGSLGISRILELAVQSNKFINPIKYILFNTDKSESTDLYTVASMIRSSGVPLDLILEPSDLPKQFKYAEKQEIAFGIFCEIEDFDSGFVRIRDLSTRKEERVAISDLINHLKTV